jgi:hypothetical protein
LPDYQITLKGKTEHVSENLGINGPAPPTMGLTQEMTLSTFFAVQDLCKLIHCLFEVQRSFSYLQVAHDNGLRSDPVFY